MINDLSLPERLAGKLAGILERTIATGSNSDIKSVAGGDVERGLATVEVDMSSRKYRPASQLRDLGLLPPLPPPSVYLSGSDAVELPPPSPRTAPAVDTTGDWQVGEQV